jgi:hypothetical protein
MRDQKLADAAYRMRSWLKALVVLFALMGGLPAAAWAHAGHEHKPGPAVRHYVAQLPAAQATASRGDVKAGELTAIATHSVERHSREHQVAQTGDGRCSVRMDRAQARLDTIPLEGPAEPIGLGTCCCGGIACHAGMTAPIPAVMEPWAPSGRIELAPAPALAGTVTDGIERPPRSAVPL